jgi:hypothetical protein
MNLINRLVIILLLLLLAIGASSVVALAWLRPEESIAGLGDAVNWLDDNNETLQRIVLTSVGLLIALLALSALIFELVPHAGTDVKVTDVRAGDAVLSTASIGQRIEEAVREVPNISEARSVVRPKRKGVLVSLDLHVEPEANLAAVANDAADAIRDVLADKVHVALLQPPKIRLHYKELRLERARLGRRPEPQPTQAASSQQEPELAPGAVQTNGGATSEWQEAEVEAAATTEERREESRDS